MVEFKKPKFNFDSDDSDSLVNSDKVSGSLSNSGGNSEGGSKFRPIRFPGSSVDGGSDSVSGKSSLNISESDSLRGSNSSSDSSVVAGDDSSSTVNNTAGSVVDDKDSVSVGSDSYSTVDGGSDGVNNSTSVDSFNPLLDDEDEYSALGSGVGDNGVVGDFSDGVDDSWDSFEDEFFDEFVGEDDESVSVSPSYGGSGSSSVGGDFVIDVGAVARGVQDRESFVDSDEEVEPFVGFGSGSDDSKDDKSVSVETDDKGSVSSVVDACSSVDSDGVNNSTSVDSFNPLLDDEDYDEPVSVLNSSVDDSVGGSVDSSVVSDNDSDDGVGGSSLDDSVVEAREVVVGGTEFESLLSDGDAERLGVFQESKAAGRERSRVINEKVRRDRERRDGSKRGPRAIDSDFKRKPVREVVVGADGVLSSDDDSVVEVDESLAKGSVGGRERYRYLSSDGRVNVAELDFFKNLGGSRSAVLGDDSLVSSLRGVSDGLGESESERKARVVLYEQALRGKDGLKRGSRSSFNAKDRETLMFLAMFRYATDAQLARMFSCSVQTSYNRLKKLRAVGLVIDRKIYGARPIWFLTEPGLLLSGFDLPRVTESKLTFSMFPHQFTVNNTAANLWGANVNVLNLPDFPSRNRVNDKGAEVFGEQLASELEIQSSFGKIKMFDKSDVYRPELLAEIDKQFRAWERAGGSEFGVSPEQVLGNEYMWALMPPFNIKLAYHVPDLVVKRERNADGSPESIAVEIEINNKSSTSYEKTLRAYRADNRLYKKVIWVCKNVGPARKLEQIAKEIGLWQEGRIDIVPVITENGVFKERDLWMI